MLEVPLTTHQPTCYIICLIVMIDVSCLHDDRSSGAVVTVQRVQRRLQIFRLTYLLTYLLYIELDTLLVLNLAVWPSVFIVPAPV